MVLDAAETILFPSGVTPKSIKKSVSLLKAISEDDLTKLLKIVQSRILGNQATDIAELSIPYNTKTEIYEGIDDLFSAICKIPKSKLTDQVLRNELKSIHIEERFITTIIDYFLTKDNISIMRKSTYPNYTTLSNCKWRIDVAISTSSLQRSLQPSILMELTLSNNEKHVFEMTLEKFNDLRFNVADMLKSILETESKLATRV